MAPVRALAGAKLHRGGPAVGASARCGLRGAKLVGANLTKADLHGADLTHAALSAGDLVGANWSRATLRRANVVCADLRGDDLPGACLKDTGLTDAPMTLTLAGPPVSTHDSTGQCR